MNIDEDTCRWLGIPTPLERLKQHALLLENEIQQLSLQLRKAREDIHGMVQMLTEAEAVKTQFRGYLAERGAEAAAMRKQIDALRTSAGSSKREAETLRGMLNDLMSRPKTIV